MATEPTPSTSSRLEHTHVHMSLSQSHTPPAVLELMYSTDLSSQVTSRPRHRQRRGHPLLRKSPSTSRGSTTAHTHRSRLLYSAFWVRKNKEMKEDEEGAAIAIGPGCGGGAWDTATQPMP